MANYDWTGEQTGVDWFQPKWDLWIAGVEKFQPILEMEPKDIKRLYNISPLFRQFYRTTKKQMRYYEKFMEALKDEE